MTDEMTDERLAEIRGRAEEATLAPWVRCSTDFREHRSHSAKTVASGMVIAFAGYGPDGGTVWCDAEFIAHARQDVPNLLAEVERLREQVETLQAEREDMTEWHRVRARGGGIYYAKNEKDALKYLLEVGGVLESRLCTPWLPATEEGPTP